MFASGLLATATRAGRRRLPLPWGPLRLAPLGLLVLLAGGCGTAHPAPRPASAATLAASATAERAISTPPPAVTNPATPSEPPLATAPPAPIASSTPDPAAIEAALSTLDVIPAATPAGAESGWAGETSQSAWGSSAASAPAAPAVKVRPGPKYWGVATYYGADFQGQPMAAGPAFDMRDPTVTASNSWPLGTRLRITRIPGGPWDNLLTPAERQIYFSRSIVVTVLDRGAFTHALDLSWGAFSELGNPAEGVIR